MNNTEKLIKYLNDKFKTSNTNVIYIYKIELSKIGLSELEVVQTIHLLKEDGLLEIVKISPNYDLNIPCMVALKSDCINYFDNKKIINESNRRNWVESYGIAILSIVALIVSIIALIKKGQ